MMTSYRAVNHRLVAESIAREIEAGRIGNTTAWEACTNRQKCGGLNRAGRAIIHRALKRAGYAFYLGRFSDEWNSWREWGIIHQDGIPRLQASADVIAFGYTLQQCAHVFGGGDAKAGWREINSW